jgi:hypothetical protein
MTDLYYWEQRTMTGKWTPCTAPLPPIPSKLVRITKPRRVPERLQGLTPMELQQLSWPEAVAILAGEGKI